MTGLIQGSKYPRYSINEIENPQNLYKSDTFNTKININLNQNIRKEDCCKNYEKMSYPNLSEINIKDNNNNGINYSVVDTLDLNDVNIDIDYTNFKSIEVENLFEVEKFMKENIIQDENEKEENENKTYKELKIYEKEHLKKIFLEKKRFLRKIILIKKI